MNIVKKINLYAFKKHDDEFRINLFELLDVAKELINDKKFLQAGLVYLECTNLAAGFNDQITLNCTLNGILYLDKASKDLPVDSFEAILSLHNLCSLIGFSFIFVKDNSGLKEVQLKIKEELAHRLFSKAEYDKINKAKYLIHGFQISYDLKSDIKCIYPKFQLYGNQKTYDNEVITYDIAGAFYDFKDIRDFKGCIQIAEANKELFTSSELMGWYNASLGWLNPDKSSKYFLEAHKAFARCNNENLEEIYEGCDPKNIELWSPYYLSLHYLSNSVNDLDNGKNWILKAASVFNENESRFLDSTVTRYELIIKAIAKCINNPKGFEVEAAIKNYIQYSKYTGTLETDIHSIAFISGLREILLSFQETPKEEIKRGRLLQLIEQLNKITVLEEKQTQSIEKIIVSEAFVLCQGPTSWIYRKLESVTDEDLLRKILLRLFQSLTPIYSQNIHGIVEHGRDIIILKKEHSQIILELYQVKVGDISTSNWREIKPQLEEMMEVVPPDSLELEGEKYIKIGILAFNGHVNSIVDPKVEGWKKKRLKEMNETYQIMHLDKIVNFIFNNRLVNEFREIMNEYNF